MCTKDSRPTSKNSASKIPRSGIVTPNKSAARSANSGMPVPKAPSSSSLQIPIKIVSRKASASATASDACRRKVSRIAKISVKSRSEILTCWVLSAANPRSSCKIPAATRRKIHAKSRYFRIFNVIGTHRRRLKFRAHFCAH